VGKSCQRKQMKGTGGLEKRDPSFSSDSLLFQRMLRGRNQRPTTTYLQGGEMTGRGTNMASLDKG